MFGTVEVECICPLSKKAISKVGSVPMSVYLATCVIFGSKHGHQCKICLHASVDRICYCLAAQKKASSVAKYLTFNITYRHAMHAAEAIAKTLRNGKTQCARYMLGDLLMRMRSANIFGDDWWPSGLVDTDQFRSALVLLGSGGMGSAVHVDWSEAINLALAITGCWNEGLALALWMFVKPSAMAELEELMKASSAGLAAATANLKGKKAVEATQKFAAAARKKAAKGEGLSKLYPEGLQTGMIPAFTEADMRYIAKVMGPDKVQLVEQHAGEVVRVRVGWGHAVVNLQPCIKVAYDRYLSANFPRYAVSHAMTAPMFGLNNAQDYTGWTVVRLSF